MVIGGGGSGGDGCGFKSILREQGPVFVSVKIVPEVGILPVWQLYLTASI